MKSYAFVRSVGAKFVSYKPHTEIPRPSSPSFSHYLYFLFAPTLIYRDSYPRWDNLISHSYQNAAEKAAQTQSIFQDERDQVENSASPFYRSWLGDLLHCLPHGAFHGANIQRLRHTILGLEVVPEKYPRDNDTRHTCVSLLFLLLAARLAERLGGDAAIRRSFVLQSESLDCLAIVLSQVFIVWSYV